MSTRELTGRHVFAITATAFAVIIGVNVTLAAKAGGTFPGLETKNSYVASQSFDADRAAQEALGWDVTARVEAGNLRLSIRDAQGPVEPLEMTATLGRATHVADDRTPVFAFDGTEHVAPVSLDRGNWNLRLVAVAEDGTAFRQRIVLRVK